MYRPVSEMLLSRHGFPPQPLYCHKCGYKTCRQSHWYCTPGNSMRRAFPYCTCTMLRCRSGCAGFSCVFSIHTYWDGCAPTWAVFFGVQCSTNQAKRGGAPIEWMVAECNCQCCWPFTCPVFFGGEIRVKPQFIILCFWNQHWLQVVPTSNSSCSVNPLPIFHKSIEFLLVVYPHAIPMSLPWYSILTGFQTSSHCWIQPLHGLCHRAFCWLMPWSK